MSDVFLSGDVVFDGTEDAKRFAARLEEASLDEGGQRHHGSDAIDALSTMEFLVEAVICDGGYATFELEIGDSFDAKEFAGFAESMGASAVLLSQVDEGQENPHTISRKAGKRARPSTVQKLVEKASPGYTAHRLISDERYKPLLTMLQNGLTPNARAFKQPLLVGAAMSAHRGPQFVELLLDFGADPNELGCKFCWEPGDGAPINVTPLFVLTISGCHTGERAQASAAAMRALLKAGADIDDPGPGGKYTPLQASVWNYNIEHFDLLMEAGSDIEKTTEVLVAPPLSTAVDKYLEIPRDVHKEIIVKLIRAKASTAIVDLDGQPLGDIYDVLPEVLDWLKG